MLNFDCFRQNANRGRPERRLSLGEYRRAESWSKYLVSDGGEIKEGEEEWSADMSQLFIGDKFAKGRHSRIYRGMYKQREVAIKIVSQPEEDESLASSLEMQFKSEVSFLLCLQHPNIVGVSSVYYLDVLSHLSAYLCGLCFSNFVSIIHSFPSLCNFLHFWYLCSYFGAVFSNVSRITRLYFEESTISYTMHSFSLV